MLHSIYLHRHVFHLSLTELSWSLAFSICLLSFMAAKPGWQRNTSYMISSLVEQQLQLLHFLWALKDWHIFMWQLLEILKRFQYFNFETNFLKNANPFQKTRAPIYNWKYQDWKRNISIQSCSVKKNRMDSTKWNYHRQRIFDSN